MTSVMTTLIYPVNDLTKAKKLYGTLLGVEPYVDQAYYVGFRVGDQEIGLDPHGHRETGAVAYRDVDDIEATVKTLIDAGAEAVQEPKQVGGGMRVATLKDADGNAFGLRSR